MTVQFCEFLLFLYFWMMDGANWTRFENGEHSHEREFIWSCRRQEAAAAAAKGGRCGIFLVAIYIYIYLFLYIFGNSASRLGKIVQTNEVRIPLCKTSWIHEAKLTCLKFWVKGAWSMLILQIRLIALPAFLKNNQWDGHGHPCVKIDVFLLLNCWRRIFWSGCRCLYCGYVCLCWRCTVSTVDRKG